MKELTLGEAEKLHAQKYRSIAPTHLQGEKWELALGDAGYPESLLALQDPPKKLYGLGNVEALENGLAIIGARKATPYGLACARLFSQVAAEKGISIISGGALGCDSQAHRAAIDANGRTVVVLGGGCSKIYPQQNKNLFQEVLDKGGAVISEQSWDFPPLPYTFRARNRIIAALSKATLIVEAGLPSGTFSTADDALEANKEVLVVPGAITSPTSKGANRLLYQGATPVVDVETFEDVLFALYGTLKAPSPSQEKATNDPLLLALQAEPLRIEDMLSLSFPVPDSMDKLTWISLQLATWQRDGLIAKFPDGRYGPSQV